MHMGRVASAMTPHRLSIALQPSHSHAEPQHRRSHTFGRAGALRLSSVLDCWVALIMGFYF